MNVQTAANTEVVRANVKEDVCRFAVFCTFTRLPLRQSWAGLAFHNNGGLVSTATLLWVSGTADKLDEGTTGAHCLDTNCIGCFWSGVFRFAQLRCRKLVTP